MYCLEYLTTDQLNKLFESCRHWYSESEWILPDNSDFFFPGQLMQDAVADDIATSFYGHTQFKEDFKEV